MTTNRTINGAQRAQVADQDTLPARLTKPQSVAPDQNATSATHYARLGYPALPIKRDSKVVDLPNGFHGAMLDPAEIRAAFKPQHGVGIAPGADVLVIDFDVGKNKRIPLFKRIAETEKRYSDMCRRYPEMVDAPTHRTPSGGYHVFLRLPDGAPQLTACPWPRGAAETYGELRGLGRSYVLAPWPRSDYRVIRALVPPSQLPVASVELVEYLHPARRPTTKKPTPSPQRQNFNRYVESALEGECARVSTAPEGRRNATLNIAAVKLGSLVGAGMLAEQVAFDSLMEAAETCGLPDWETQKTIASGLAFGKANPRQLERHAD